jgi:anti-sigma-K factor RskA
VTKEEIISSGLLELYALGQLSETEQSEVEALLQRDPSVREELNQIELSLEAFAQAQAIPVAPSVKDKLLQSIQSGETSQAAHTPAPVVSMQRGPWKLIAAASWLLLAGSVFLTWQYRNQAQTAETEKENTRSQLIALQSENSTMKQDMQVIQSKYSEPVYLKGLEAAPDAAAKIFWMKNTGEVYIDPSNLPETPKGMEYQLWAIVDGQPVDAGMIITTESQKKYRIQKMKSFGKVDAFAVTLETAGGNPSPKGTMYVMGKM